MTISNTGQHERFYLLPEAILSIILGGFIYIMFRTDSLVMFGWFEQLGISEYIHDLRGNGNISYTGAIRTFINTVPGGLWTFSYSVFLLLIWNMEINSRNVFYFIFIPVAAIASEIFQLTGIISGTFDYLDIISYMSGAMLPLLIHFQKIKINLQ
jgi:hypothetical protein